MDYFTRIKRFLLEGFMPVTKATAILAGIISLLCFAFPPLASLFVLNPANFLFRPWAIFTYPLVDQVSFSLLFAVIWLWFIGGSLERTWGSYKYLRFQLAVTALPGVLMLLITRLGVVSVPFFSLWLPLVGTTWAWAEIYPDRELLFMGIVPVKARWIGWLEVILTFISYSHIHILLGLISISGITMFYIFRNAGRHRWGHGPAFKKKMAEWQHRRKKEKFKIVK